MSARPREMGLKCPRRYITNTPGRNRVKIHREERNTKCLPSLLRN
jgi:hypothetical protein